MKRISVSKTILAAVFMWSCITQATEYIYSDLQMKSYDEMSDQVKKLVLKAQAVADDDADQAKAKLKEALQLIFSRPNPGSDNMVSKLLPTPRTPLKNLEAYEPTLLEIVSESLNKAKDKKIKVSERATHFIILENVMSELKPDAKTSPKMTEIFVKIRDAKLEVPDDVKNELRMRAMIKAPASPSDLAKKIIGSAK